MAVVDVGEHLVIDPEMMHGKLTFRDTRIPVDMIMDHLAMGYAVDQIILSWPQLTPQAVREAITLASEALHRQYAAELEAAECEARRLWDQIFARADA